MPHFCPSPPENPLTKQLRRFVTSFSIPYLLNEPYAALGSKVGFIFGGAAVLAFIFAFFCVPECTHRTLEEIDQLFLDGVPVRQFKKAKVTNIGEHDRSKVSSDPIEDASHDEGARKPDDVQTAQKPKAVYEV